MKKFAISLIALAAVSTVSFAASNRSNELRDADTYMGKYATSVSEQTTGSNALIATSANGPASNFERLSWTAWENDQAGRH